MKSKSKSEQKTQYAWNTPPKTAELSQYEDATKKFGGVNPDIGYQFGAARNRLKDRFDSPWGQDYSPEVRDAAMYQGQQELDQAQGAATREDMFNRQATQLGHFGAVAGMRAPVLTTPQVNTTGSQTQPWGPAAIGAVGTAAGGFLS